MIYIVDAIDFWEVDEHGEHFTKASKKKDEIIVKLATKGKVLLVDTNCNFESRLSYSYRNILSKIAIEIIPYHSGDLHSVFSSISSRSEKFNDVTLVVRNFSDITRDAIDEAVRHPMNEMKSRLTGFSADFVGSVSGFKDVILFRNESVRVRNTSKPDAPEIESYQEFYDELAKKGFGDFSKSHFPAGSSKRCSVDELHDFTFGKSACLVCRGVDGK